MTDTIENEEQRVEQEIMPPPQEPANATDAIRAARALIPVGATGAMPMNFAQQVDFAKTMAMAKYGLPQHLRGNAGDCLAIIDIASRAGLSPYMVGNKTYIQNDRLCFESQLFHAFLVQSKLLVGDLEFEYERQYEPGEDEGDPEIEIDSRCIVHGSLKSDGKRRTHVGGWLSKLHPGNTEKTKDGVKFTYAKGSPLWNRKPDVQLFYDTSRDWVRMNAPTATLGIYSPEEFAPDQASPGPDNARDVTARIASGPKNGEGFQGGHAETELSKIAAGGQRIIDHEDSPGKGAPGPANGAPAGSGEGAATQGPGKEKPAAARRNVGAARTAKAPTAAQVKRVADRAAAASKKKQEPAKKDAPKPEEPPAAKAKKDLKTATDYIAYAKDWIDGSFSYEEANDRWEKESDLRNELKVPIKERAPLNDRIVHKFEA